MNMTYDEKLNIIERLHSLYADSSISSRTYYSEFRKKWDKVLRKSAELEDYSYSANDAIFTVNTTFGGIDLSFHFDQLKIQEWFEKEQAKSRKAIFYTKRLKRDRYGTITYHEAVCNFDQDAPEFALTAEYRNIIACAIPEVIPKLQVVYGNKWVNDKFNALHKRTISLYLIETDFVPAFLLSPFEVCLYLFLMDYCIIKNDYSKVKDDDLKQFLHIFRPSPMLKIKGLI